MISELSAAVAWRSTFEKVSSQRPALLTICVGESFQREHITPPRHGGCAIRENLAEVFLCDVVL